MNTTVQKPAGSRINWLNVMTVGSAAILIGAEVFGAAYAGGWALANLFALGEYGVHILQAVFFVLGIVVMTRFIANARRVEPFTDS
jgi:hypothetical protein